MDCVLYGGRRSTIHCAWPWLNIVFFFLFEFWGIIQKFRNFVIMRNTWSKKMCKIVQGIINHCFRHFSHFVADFNNLFV